MQEVIHYALLPENVLYTFLLVVALIYWLVAIIGVIDLDLVDFDFGGDAEMDVDIEAEVEAGFLVEALSFFNFGKVPFMVLFSVFILSQWTISIWATYNFGGGIGFAIAMAIPMAFLSLFIAKILTTPLIPVFQSMMQEVEPVDYIGMTGKMKFPSYDGKEGQAEVVHEGDILQVDVMHEDGEELKRGESIRIMRKVADKESFLAKRLNENDDQ